MWVGQAMEAASRLTPQQMAEMQRLASSMPPAQLAEMQRMAASMPPDLVRQGMEQMNNMSPAEQLEALRRGDPSSMQATMNQAQAKFSADTGYQVGLRLALMEAGCAKRA